jgi:hypothetical protein
MGYIYAQKGPPFPFLGNMSETQRDSLVQWVNAQTEDLADIQTHHQIRAQQLRKAAGMLEQFYADAEVPLTPSFIKKTWEPEAGDTNHFAYGYRNDHRPAMTTLNLKEYFKTKLVHMDDAVFHMNHLRTAIERSEDLAQYQNDAVKKVPALINELHTLFGKDEYSVCLVRDQTDLYKGQPRYRVHQLDPPTPYEIDTRTGNTPTS